MYKRAEHLIDLSLDVNIYKKKSVKNKLYTKMSLHLQLLFYAFLMN